MGQRAFLTVAIAVLTAGVAAAVPIYYGRRKPGYSHLRHTISELGETGSSVGTRVSCWFVAVGLLQWLFLILAAGLVPPDSKQTLWWLSGVGWGYVGGGIFRCDPEAPAFGSWRTNLHNVFGIFEYVGAAAAFSMLKFEDYWSPLAVAMSFAGPLVALCLWGLAFPHPLRGLVQRVAEMTIFGGMVAMALRIGTGGQ